jgi:hypothetical protein
MTVLFFLLARAAISRCLRVHCATRTGPHEAQLHRTHNHGSKHWCKVPWNGFEPGACAQTPSADHDSAVGPASRGGRGKVGHSNSEGDGDMGRPTAYRHRPRVFVEEITAFLAGSPPARRRRPDKQALKPTSLPSAFRNSEQRGVGDERVGGRDCCLPQDSVWVRLGFRA